MKKTIYAAILLFALSSFARITDDQVQYNVVNDEISITTKKGFHLNAEAPASATFDSLEANYKPTKKTEKLFSFRIPKNSKIAHLNYYVCDDKKTVCEQHQENIEIKSAKPTEKKEKAQIEKTAKDITLASADGKPTLLVFSAPWCPACIRMKTETYPVPAVKAQLDKIHFTKLNSDLVENWDLSEKFHVKAIPTLILLNGQGEEVYRWLDFQHAAEFAKSLAVEITKTSNTKQALEKKVLLGDQAAASELGMSYYNALMYEDAVKWLSYSKNEKDQNYKLAAEAQAAQGKADENEKEIPTYLATLEKGIVLSTSEMDQLRWFVDWADKKNELGALNEDGKAKIKNIKAKLEKILSNKKNLKVLFAKSTYGDTVGFEKAEMYYLIGKLENALGSEAGKKLANENMIQIVKQKKLSVKRPGEMLIAIAYLREAEETTYVEGLYQSLRKTYPNTYVYHEKFAKFLLKYKKTEDALSTIDEAIKFPEGNMPQLLLTKAKILKELNKKELAIQTIDSALKQDQIEHKRFKSSVAALKTLREELKKN